MFTSKEHYFLEYNKDNIATDLIQSELHLRKLKKGIIGGDDGHANCVVKHALHIEGESNEATSHALIVEGSEISDNFKVLGDNTQKFRKNIQKGKLTRDKAIEAVRKLRAEFESFNPEYDVSKCESCGSLDGIIERIKGLNSNPDNGEEKVLNTKGNNSSYSESNMENIAIMYGGNFLGKLIDPYIPAAQKDIVTAGLAVGLPLLSKFAKLEKTSKPLDQTLVVLGAYEATNLVDIAMGMLTPTIRIARPTTVTRGAVQVTPTRTVGAVASKYIVS